MNKSTMIEGLEPVTETEIEPVQDIDNSPNKHKLEKPWNRAKLIRQLATNAKTQTALAKDYGVAQPTIATFKKRHKTEIEEVQNALADQVIEPYADLWIADKRNRLSALQELAEKLEELKVTARNAEVTIKIFREVADQLGDIPSKSTVDVNTNVKYEIVGINVDNLT